MIASIAAVGATALGPLAIENLKAMQTYCP